MNDNKRYNATKRVTLISGTTNSFLAIFKIIVGYLGHSQALVADGIHSFSDLISDGIVLMAAKAGSRSPDEEHPYGHRRIETLAAIAIAWLLLFIGGWIIYDAAQRLMDYRSLPPPDMWVAVMAGISVIANEWLYWLNVQVGKKIQSNLLISNAWHNRGDALTSVIVLVSVIGSRLGWKFLDGVAAMLIAIVIIKIAVKLIWDSTNELIDRACDLKTLDKINDIIKRTPGVKSVHQLRTRLHGGHIFIDLHIIVNPYISVSEGHYIGQQVHVNLQREIKAIEDVTVHIDPEDDETTMPSFDLPSREAVIERLKRKCRDLPGAGHWHNVQLHYINGQLTVDIYLPKSFTNEPNLVEQYRRLVTNDPSIAMVNVFFQ